jgi:predicted glycoside hydrolase/deacetylase ChbG (UPF0249 family)
MKLIINADDFGPIEFINQGVYHHTSAGNLDSTQVLANFDPQILEANLSKLHDAVPENRVLDLGIHYTLTSGSPITGSRSSWGKMLKTRKYEFKDYKRFNFQYDQYLNQIEAEFEAQRDRLLELTDKVNTNKGSFKLQVTSASNHHNILTIAPDIFDVYHRVSTDENLKIRSPKASPAGVMNLYYDFVFPLRNFSDAMEQRHMMNKLNDNFAENYFLETIEYDVPSPNYFDIEFYRGIANARIGRITQNKIDSRVAAFHRMVMRAQAYETNPMVEPTDLVVEAVLHLGMNSEATANLSYKEMVEDYPGVTHKYFDNREIELRALDDLSNQYDLITEDVSWNDCGIVQYRKGSADS